MILEGSFECRMVSHGWKLRKIKQEGRLGFLTARVIKPGTA